MLGVVGWQGTGGGRVAGAGGAGGAGGGGGGVAATGWFCRGGMAARRVLSALLYVLSTCHVPRTVPSSSQLGVAFPSGRPGILGVCVVG